MMSFKNIFSLAILVIISGCATTAPNVARYDIDYYRQRMINSDSVQQLKEYLTNSKIKLYHMNIIIADGTNIVNVDGNAITLTLNKTYLTQISDSSFLAGIPTVITDKIESDNYVLLYCADYTHATIKDNFESAIVGFSYTLSNMSNDEVLAMQNKRSDCSSIPLLSSNIIYKKNMQITSYLNGAKVIPIKLDKSIASLNNTENYTVLMNDINGQAVAAILADKDMLQALKDFKLTAHKISQLPKATAPEPAIQNQSVNLDEPKVKCKNLGFKEGSKDFGNCVLQLMK